MKIRLLLSSILVSVLLLNSCRKDGKDYDLKADLLSPFFILDNGDTGNPFYWHGREKTEWHTTIGELGDVQATEVHHPSFPMKLLFAKDNMKIISKPGDTVLVDYHITNNDFIQIQSNLFLDSINPVNMFVDYEIIGSFTKTSNIPPELTSYEEGSISALGNGDLEKITLRLEYVFDHQNSMKTTTIDKEFSFIRAVPNLFSSLSKPIDVFDE